MNRELVERARRGDREAFSAAVHASLPSLYAIASLILRDADHAQDAVQDGLVGAWRGVRALREPDAWEVWLQRSVVRACYRHAGRERSRQLSWARVATDEPLAEDAFASFAARDELRRVFGALTLEQRSIVVLHYYQGLPLTEVADVLGIPTGTVKSRLHRATQALRAALDADARSLARTEAPR